MNLTKKNVVISGLALVLFSLPLTVRAEDSQAVWRIQVEPPVVAVETVPQSVWGRLRLYLGARQPLRRPAPGTKIVVRSSAYASSPYQTDNTPCITAAGTRVRKGVVATNFLPLGTILTINGERYIVEDRMNSRYRGKYLDIWFPSTAEALEFGRRALEIQIVEYGTPGQDLTPPAPPKKLTVLKRTSLYLISLSAKVANLLPANVNRYDVDCTK